MRYAMVLKNKVIGILENQTEAPFWPPDNKGNAVIAIECDETVKIGMIYDANTGAFSVYKPQAKKSATAQILSIVSKTKEETENAAIDAYTLELMEGGLL